jgi:hypothetical protein
VTTDTTKNPLPEKGGKEKQRMSRVTGKTQDTLLPAAATLYPRHSHAELLEKGLEALMGIQQPVVYFCAQDPEIQIQTSAVLAEFAERLENNAKAITRAKFSDPNDQKEARTAVKEILILKDEIRFAIKEIGEDANHVQKLVGALSRLLPAANALAGRLRATAASRTKDAANLESAGDVAKAKKQSDFAAQFMAEAKTVEEIVRHLTSQKSLPPRP